MQFLKLSTGIDIRLGPFMDATDGVTPETGVTLGAADQAELLKSNGAATVDISARTFAAVTGCDGWYNLTLTTADTDTLGLLDVVVQDASVCLPVFARFMVLPANVYDSFVSGSDNLDVNATQWAGSATNAADVALAAAPTNFADLAIVATTGLVTANVTQFGGSAGTFAGGIPDVNAAQISGDGPAADNLESAYDGTGYAGGTINQDVNVVSMATDSVSSGALSAAAVTEITDDIMAEVVESQGSYTLQQVLSIMLAVLAGETSSGGNTLSTPDGVATRVAATTDGSNNRTAMTLTPSS